jgi:hypothetical protein
MNNTSCFCEIFKPYSLLFYPLLLEKKISTGLLERESTISNNTERNIIENKMLNGNGQTQLSRVY